MKSLRELLRESVPAEESFAKAKSFGEPAIKQGTWLTTSLWNGHAWSLKLKDRGVGWSDFMQAYGTAQYSFVKWKRGEKSWEAAMEDFIDAIVESR